MYECSKHGDEHDCCSGDGSRLGNVVSLAAIVKTKAGLRMQEDKIQNTRRIRKLYEIDVLRAMG